MLKKLEFLLQQSLSQVRLIQSQDPNASQHIRNQLDRVGIALVEHPHTEYVKILTGSHMSTTFPYLSKKTREDLDKGNFDAFSKEWMGSPVTKTQIMFKGNGMANSPPIGPKQRSAYKHPLTAPNTVHTRNSLNAMNNILLWNHLISSNPSLAPENWFARPMQNRIQVSEDSVKILNRKQYGPTQMHYDGQLGKTEGKDARRIQIVYTADKGPIKLFCVPGTHKPEILDLIRKLTKTKGQPGFISLQKEFKKLPNLRNLLYKYGVSLPKSGLLMFRANVWHFEGSGIPMQNGIIVNRHNDIKKLKPLTKQTEVFRIYCGVVSVAPRLIHDLIVLAYLRVSGWSMDVYSPENRNHELFVNQKSTQFWKICIQPKGFDKLKNADIITMKRKLNYYSDQMLSLFGLTREDVNPNPELPIRDISQKL